MVVIEIRFPAHRYHATPWDAHVNEGQIEWPPCPWRFLRALIAVGYAKFGWTEPPAVAQRLISKLADSPPKFRLPQADASHTRHYMPKGEFQTGSRNEATAKVIDTFLRFREDDQLLIFFNVLLEPEERSELASLVSGITYFGRAESWIEAKLLEDESSTRLSDEISDWVSVEGHHDSTNRVRTLVPMREQEFNAWRTEAATAAAGKAEAERRKELESKEQAVTPAKLQTARRNAEKPYPVDFISAIQQIAPAWAPNYGNSGWQKAGWPRPPGSKWVDYAVPKDAFSPLPFKPPSVHPHVEKPRVLLLSIDGEGKQGQLRPLMQRALPLMELLHSEAVRYATRKLKLGNLPELSGCDADGHSLSGHHGHAHWLPLSFDDGRTIDHVACFAPDGFSTDAVQAVSCIRWAYAKNIRSLSVNLVGQGTVDEIVEQLERESCSLVTSDAKSIFTLATTWESFTPLVLRKYLSRGKKSIAGQLKEELLERGLPAPESVDVLLHQEAAKRGLKGWVMTRGATKPQPPFERSWGVRIQFAQPIQGPLSLGYASHFGLGMFRAVL